MPRFPNWVVAKNSPEGEKAKEVTGVLVENQSISLLETISQTRTVQSMPELINHLESWLKQQSVIWFLCPLNFLTNLFVSTSNIRITRSSAITASRLLSLSYSICVIDDFMSMLLFTSSLSNPQNLITPIPRHLLVSASISLFSLFLQ